MSDFYIGEIRNFAFGKVPTGWAACNGALLQIQSNTALYSLIGTTYGGNGTTTFALPDLRGRVGVSKNPGSGGLNPAASQYPLGQAGGAETVILTQAQMPSHNHQLQGRSEAGTTGAIAGDYISTSGTNATITTPQPLYAPIGAPVPLNPGSVSSAGGNVAHANMQPYEVTNYCIATTGLYPARS